MMVKSNEPIGRQLAMAIVSASAELKKALEGNKALMLSELSASIKFEVSRTKSGEIGIDVGSVSIGGSREGASGISHSITLNFARDGK